MKVTKILTIAFLFAAVASTSHAQQVLEKKTLTLAGAKKVIAAAVAKAKELNAPGAVIAVVDDGGNLMALERLDNTFAAGALISYGKARTSAIFKRPTAVFEKIIREGRTPMVALNDFTPLQGGVPIEMNGQVVGAIGVSGAASAQQDEELAIAGAGALSMNTNGTASMSAVAFFDSKSVAAAFIKGQPLLETGEYKIHASHRDGPGKAEVHEHETDIIYVLEGTATFVTGGKVVGGEMTAPGEIRGAGIEGGDTRKLVKGDVLIVPQGVPHWFKDLKAPFNYYVVKSIN
ncbi:heme-binding protein [candidate division KSB1 bacterium]|nr:heme-binding protein [candidate division KSB1 bacterium]